MDTLNFVAYRGTGKDTLAKTLIDRDMPELKRLGWKVYGPALQPPPKFDLYPPVRVALADTLKEELCDDLNIPRSFVHSGEFEQYKDLPRTECPPFLEEALRKAGYPRCREAMIAMAKQRKEKYGSKYYVNLVQDKVERAHQNGQTILLTDIRDHPDVRPGTSLRLFRSDIPIPPADDMSERRMDIYLADYVLCKSDPDLMAIQVLQPQYGQYVYRAELVDVVSYVQS
jgi:hypothetical protein